MTNSQFTIEQRDNMKDMYLSGLSLQKIANKYGITKQAVNYILKKYGIDKSQGGFTTKVFINIRENRLKKPVNIRKEIQSLKNYGCSLEVKNSFEDGVIEKYKRQKYTAKSRGIEFKLSLIEWWDIWQESGHWHERGFGGGKYVMARTCDIGSYEICNVKIITHNENSSEARLMDKVFKRKHLKMFCNVEENNI